MKRILYGVALATLMAVIPLKMQTGNDANQPSQVTTQAQAVSTSTSVAATVSRYLQSHTFLTLQWQNAQADEYDGWGQDENPLEYIRGLIEWFYGKASPQRR